MNRDIAEGKWKEIKGAVREQWGKLTDDEIDQAKGKAEQLSGLLQKHYGYTKDKAEAEIDRAFRSFDESTQKKPVTTP